MSKKRGEGITHVKNLFAKYAIVLKAPQKTVIHTFVDATEAVIGHTVRSEHCSYSLHSRTLTIAASGVLKTEILLRKKDILAAMTHILGEKNVPVDIL